MTALQDTTEQGVERSWRSALGVAAVCCWTVLVGPMAWFFWFLWTLARGCPYRAEHDCLFALIALILGLPMVGALVWMKKKRLAIVAITVALVAIGGCFLLREILAMAAVMLLYWP